jgi:hypothetical protein
LRTLKLAVLLVLPLALSCMTGPLNGDTRSGGTIGASIGVDGFYIKPNIQIDVQVLGAPTMDPGVDANWTTLATTWSSNSAFPVNGDNLYTWSTSIVPVPNILYSGRWPLGGLVKIRAVGREGGSTYFTKTFDSVAWTDCLNTELVAGTPGQSIGLVCNGLGRTITSVVSTGNNPADKSPPAREFLYLKGDISDPETQAYYGGWAAPATLNDFRSYYNYPGTGDVTATFYNDSDLGVGREMHCWKYTRGLFNTIEGTACYVSNYSDTAGTPKFGNNNVTTALNNAIAHAGKFATVAMVTEKSIFSGTPGEVDFVAFNAAGNRVDNAQLDNANLHTSIPNNCLTCHGVDTYYDSTSHTIGGRANFLPFDPSGYKFTASGSYTRSAQENALRVLNSYVKDTQPSAAIVSLIDGSYAPSTVTTVGASWNDDYVPAAWTGSNPREDYPTLYKGVVRQYCRTCHVSAGAYRDFADAQDFENLKLGIMDRACGSNAVGGNYFMPHAEHPMRKFWASGARAYLNAWGGDAAHNGCKP